MWGFHHHNHHHRGCGPRGGGWRRGPLEARWQFGERGEGRGSGRRRMFDGDELRLILLALIAEQPRHGYDLIREIEARTGGGYAPSPGVVYPTLTLLDEMALIEAAQEEGARKRFAATEAGRAWLAERREAADAVLARLAEIGAHRERSDRPSIRRAMTGLHMALREALGDGDAERAQAIAAILDEATQRIERL